VVDYDIEGYYEASLLSIVRGNTWKVKLANGEDIEVASNNFK
jgi:hypothetical protein